MRGKYIRIIYKEGVSDTEEVYSRGKELSSPQQGLPCLFYSGKAGVEAATFAVGSTLPGECTAGERRLYRYYVCEGEPLLRMREERESRD